MLARYSSLADGHRGVERLIEEGVDAIVAGFPCQDISLAGDGAGLSGSRSGLVWNLLRTIRLVRPPVAVLENVAALLGRGLGQILGHLASVGYDTEWHCIPASAVGAPHQRDRVWLIATDAGSEQHQGNSAPLSGEIAAQLPRSAAYADSLRELQPQGRQQDQREWFGDSGALCDPNSSRLPGGGSQSFGEDGREAGRAPSPADWWSVEPDVGRMAHGIPARVDRLRCLGNAVVPQIPEIIGRAIMTSTSRPAGPALPKSITDRRRT